MDELGFVPLSKTGAGLLFELVSQRYERGAALNASNLPFDEWAETFGTERLTGALRDWPPAPCAHVTPNPKLTCFCAPPVVELYFAVDTCSACHKICRCGWGIHTISVPFLELFSSKLDI